MHFTSYQLTFAALLNNFQNVNLYTVINLFIPCFGWASVVDPIMNSAACIITSTWKFHHSLTHIWRDILHWLVVRCTRMCHIQVTMTVYKSAWNGSDVSVRNVPANLIGGWPSISFSWPWTTRHSSLQTNHCWQKGILPHWIVCSLPPYAKAKTLTLTLLCTGLNVFCLLCTDSAYCRVHYLLLLLRFSGLDGRFMTLFSSTNFCLQPLSLTLHRTCWLHHLAFVAVSFLL